uniref:Uncharacterized protein n=1 Tax=Ditylenchus dipsaci TaxID=166011 RepID=A0A915DK09_9BILA
MHLRKGTKENAEAPPPPSPTLNYRKSMKKDAKVSKSRSQSKDSKGGLLSAILRKGNNSRSPIRSITGKMGSSSVSTSGKRATKGFSPDKSTEPLFMPNINNGRASFASDDSAGGGTLVMIGSSGGGHDSQIKCRDMGLSLDEDRDSDPDSPTSAKMVLPTNANTRPSNAAYSNVAESNPPNSATRREQMAAHVKSFNDNIRQNRQLAQKEYEWLATVLERCCFIIFVMIFIALTSGINLIGYFHWSDVDNNALYQEAVGDYVISER